MKTEIVSIDSLQFDPANVRKHGEKNLAAIKSSLARFGQQKPIVVDANGVCRAGNGTLAAAKALGWKEVAIVRSPLAGAEATAYAIADNRTSELAEWDDDVTDKVAAAMLQRQQAAAIIAARTRIVEGAVGMVKLALDKLEQQNVVVLDEQDLAGAHARDQALESARAKGEFALPEEKNYFPNEYCTLTDESNPKKRQHVGLERSGAEL